jgi:hypothetical protein
LGAVLDDVDAAWAGEGEQFLHGRELAEEMDGNDGAGAGRDAAGDFGGIEAEGAGMDVGEDDLRAALVDALGGGDVGEGRGDDFVAGADVEGAEGEGEGVGAGVDADAVAGAGVGGDLGFEGGDVRAEDVVAGGEGAFNGGEQLVFEGVVLGGEVEEGDLHGRERFWGNYAGLHCGRNCAFASGIHWRSCCTRVSSSG